MTEVSVDEILQAESELKGDSRLVILIGSLEGIKSVSKKLAALEGVIRIRKGSYIIHGFSEIHETILESQKRVSFIKTREIPTVRTKLEEAYTERVYSIVSFSYNNPTAQQKKYVERLLRKTTGIRLRPGVILFPLLRSKEQRRILGSEEERVLIDSIDFSKMVRENGGKALRWSRLKITNCEGSSHVRHAVERTLHTDLIALEKRIRTLRERCKDPEVPIGKLKKNYTILSRSFRRSKTKWMLAKKLWFYDAEKSLKRTYNMLISTRRVIITQETTRAS